MRHLGSLALSLLVAPVIYFLIGVSVDQWTDAAESGNSKYTALTLSLAAALAAGMLYGMLLLVRLSPLGLVLAGLAFLGVAAWSTFAESNFLDVMPRQLFGISGPPSGPINAVLAVPLLLTVFSPRRWRRWGSPMATVAPTPGYSPPPAPSYDAAGHTPSHDPSGYTPPGSPVGYPPPGPPWGASDDPQDTRRL